MTFRIKFLYISHRHPDDYLGDNLCFLKKKHTFFVQCYPSPHILKAFESPRAQYQGTGQGNFFSHLKIIKTYFS